MIKIALVSLSLISAVLFSCSNSGKQAPKLNEEEFIQILIDIHLADGTLSSENIYRSGDNFRPSYYYNSIYEKHNIKRAEFDSCVSYYAHNPTNFTSIYDIVIDSLNRLETKYRIEIKNAKLERDTVNLWKKKQHWRVFRKNKPKFDFNIPINVPGIYTITADIRIFPKDQTENPKMEACFWKADTTNGAQKIHFEPLQIVKDSVFRTYSMQLEYPDSIYTHLKGNLFKWENDLEVFTQDYEIKNIKIFNPDMKPDSAEIEKEIRRHLDHEDIMHFRE